MNRLERKSMAALRRAREVLEHARELEERSRRLDERIKLVLAGRYPAPSDKKPCLNFHA